MMVLRNAVFAVDAPSSGPDQQIVALHHYDPVAGTTRQRFRAKHAAATSSLVLTVSDTPLSKTSSLQWHLPLSESELLEAFMAATDIGGWGAIAADDVFAEPRE